ncbi:MAG TPA: hypothetical protein VJN70_12720 [Gemmatimonadaceae bacterium]|nr:hypothetical protein [Gemmatimonadaceae bacterium]
MGATVAAAAAAAHRKRITHVLDAFRIAGATGSDRAQSLEEIGIEQSRELDELTRAGVVTAGDRRSTWYLNEAAYIAFRDSSPRRVLRVVLALVLATLAILVGLIAYRTSS